MSSRRLVEFVVTSRVLSGAELVILLGPADESVETYGDFVGRPGAFRVVEKSAWIASSGLGETASVEAHLAALHARVRPVVNRLVLSGEIQAVESVLRIVQYLSCSEPQGHGFVIGSEWFEILGALHGVLDVDQYVIEDGEL